jgi:hypothetical protein
MGKSSQRKKTRRLTDTNVLGIGEKEWIDEKREYDQKMLELAQIERQRRQEMISQPLPDNWTKESDYCDVFEEAIKINFFIEKNALVKRVKNKQRMTMFNTGRWKLFEALDRFIVLNAAATNPKDPLIVQIKEAGQLINDSIKESPHISNPMHDPMIWLFIPKSLHGFIEYCWHGIGEWRA